MFVFKIIWGSVFNLWTMAHWWTIASGITVGGQGCEPPSWQAKCKNQAPTYLTF